MLRLSARRVVQQRPTSLVRPLFGWARKAKNAEPASTTPKASKVALEQDNLFHPLSQSPFPVLKARAETITSMAPCPVCLTVHSQRKPAQFDCPDCGFPTHCSEFHWQEDSEHAKYCGRLREVNEDEHDLRSGRRLSEFDMPGVQSYEEAISFANWDIFWYTRGFPSVDSERSRRHASKLLTYPITIGGVLHQNSGLNSRNQRVTPEGMRSLAALRMTLHPPAGTPEKNDPSTDRPTVRIFLLGARGESSLPPHVWEQLAALFPSGSFHIYMIGPEVSLPRNFDPPPYREEKDIKIEDLEQKPDPTAVVLPSDIYTPPHMKFIQTAKRMRSEENNYGVPSYTNAVSPSLTITALQARYSDVHAQLGPFDPYTDVFFAFSPGFGFPSPTQPTELQIASPAEWGLVVPLVLETKCPLFVTGFSPTDVERDVRSLDGVEGIAGQFDWVLTPGENPFGSEKWEVAEFDPRVMVKTNWGVWGIRGKRHDIEETS
jgi:splicing suppressor protein 51